VLSPQIKQLKGLIEPLQGNPPPDVLGGSIIQHGPSADCIVVSMHFRSPKQKRCRVLGFHNQRFQPPRGDDSKVRIRHTPRGTMTCLYE
jgi:hypothetical protein